MKVSTDDPKLTAYALGEMNKEECVEFDQELARSPELRAAVSAIRQTAALLHQEFATENSPSALSVEELFATRRMVSLPKRRTWFAAGVAAAAGIAVVLAWQFWLRDTRYAAPSVGVNSTTTGAKLECDPATAEQDRTALSDVANVSYNPGEFRPRQFVADLGAGLSLDIWRRNRLRFDYGGHEMSARNPVGLNEGGRFNFRVGYQLEF